jgi:thioredoxin 1
MDFHETIIELDESNHEDFLESQLAIIHFFSDWHMNCLLSLPLLEDAAEEFSSRIKFGKLNIEEYEEIAKQHKITCIPAVVFFKNGEQVDRIENQVNEDILKEKIICLLQ